MKKIAFSLLALIIFSNIQTNPYKLMSSAGRACLFYLRPKLLKIMPDVVKLSKRDIQAVKEVVTEPCASQEIVNVLTNNGIKFGKLLKNSAKKMILGTYLFFSAIPFKSIFGLIGGYLWFKNKQGKKLIIKPKKA